LFMRWGGWVVLLRTVQEKTENWGGSRSSWWGNLRGVQDDDVAQGLQEGLMNECNDNFRQTKRFWWEVSR
jgi:hypothetical protein